MKRYYFYKGKEVKVLAYLSGFAFIRFVESTVIEVILASELKKGA